MRVSFFDVKEYDRQFFSQFDGQNDFSFQFFETRLNSDTVALAHGADAVCVFVNDDVNHDVIEQLESFGIRLIALRCAGFNNVNLSAAFGHVHVVHVPAYSPHAVAEHAMALLLTSIRRIHKAYNRTKDFNFSLNGLTGFELHGKTVGIVGTGRIGRIFIDICRGFGMQVLAFDKYPAQDTDIHYVALDELIAQSDIISLHCPLTEETYHIIGREQIASMKPGVILINTSRGALIHSEALLEGIKNRQIGAACLDVYEEESELFFEDFSGHIVSDDTLARLMTMPNVIVTSHQAFLTQEALRNIAEVTVSNLLDFFDGKPLKNEICYRCAELGTCRKQRKARCF